MRNVPGGAYGAQAAQQAADTQRSDYVVDPQQVGYVSQEGVDYDYECFPVGPSSGYRQY